MKASYWLRAATKTLEKSDIATARLDCLVLLEDVTNKDRAWLLAHPESEISSQQLTLLQNLLNRRSVHEPLAYLRQKSEFYGREFKISPAVLVPRPESETIIQELKALLLSPVVNSTSDPKMRLADVGTGSGALGITAKLEFPSLSVELLDIDPDALQMAKINVDKFTLDMSVTESDLLSAATQQNDIILCNLPYVPDDYKINSSAAYEPSVALFGGPDGLDIYRKLFDQLAGNDTKPLYILSEALPEQHQKLAELASAAGYTQIQRNGFVQVFSTSR